MNANSHSKFNLLQIHPNSIVQVKEKQWKEHKTLYKLYHDDEKG